MEHFLPYFSSSSNLRVFADFVNEESSFIYEQFKEVLYRIEMFEFGKGMDRKKQEAPEIKTLFESLKNEFGDMERLQGETSKAYVARVTRNLQNLRNRINVIYRISHETT